MLKRNFGQVICHPPPIGNCNGDRSLLLIRLDYEINIANGSKIIVIDSDVGVIG